MIVLDYTLTARSRVSVGQGPAVINDRPLQEVLPGSTVRGALATAYARDTGMAWTTPSADFVAGFESTIRFGPAIPTGRHVEPLSWVRCKYPGDSCSPTPIDISFLVRDGSDIPPRCPSCLGGWEVGKGDLIDLVGESNADADVTPRPRTVRTTRTALDAEGVAVPGMLFTRRALSEGTLATGQIVADEDAPATVLTWLGSERRIRVGGQRTVLGAMTWTTARSGVSLPSAPSRAVLRCVSPMILIDEYGAPTLDPASAFARRLDGARIVAHWTRPVRITGWHAASGLPKPEEWALAAGSTFVVDGLPPDTATRLLTGVGLRTLEGFGRLDLCLTAPVPPERSVPETPPEAPPVDPAAARATALCAGLTAAPTDELQRQLVQAVDEGIGEIAKLRRTGRETKANTTATRLLELPVIRQYLRGEALDALRWVLTEADADQLRTVRVKTGELR